MFERLDTINWEQLGTHTYPCEPNIDIPKAIRDLVIGGDEDTRLSALGFLLGEGQDTGDIYDTTPQIIPFIIEALSFEGTPDKHHLLEYLTSVLESPILTGESIWAPVHQIRLYLQTYDAIETGINILLDFLHSNNDMIRSACVRLLGRLTNSVELIAPNLRIAFDSESNEDVQIAIVYALDSLFTTVPTWDFERRKPYVSFFMELVKNHSSRRVRIEAAQSSIMKVHIRDLANSSELADVLSIVTLVLSDAYWQDYSNDEFRRERIVDFLADLPNLTAIIDLLNDARTTVRQIHQLVHSVLSGKWSKTISEDYWRDIHSEVFDDGTRINYFRDYSFPLRINDFGTPRPNKLPVIKWLVSDDKFWTVPTNFLSFFYNLPDDREELRKLISESKSKL